MTALIKMKGALYLIILRVWSKNYRGVGWGGPEQKRGGSSFTHGGVGHPIFNRNRHIVKNILLIIEGLILLK